MSARVERNAQFNLPEGSGSDRDGDRGTGVDDLLATDETVGTVHSNGSNSVLTQVLGDLENETTLLSTLELDLEGVENRREVVRVEVDIDNGTNDGLDRTGLDSGRGSVTTGRD